MQGSPGAAKPREYSRPSSPPAAPSVIGLHLLLFLAIPEAGSVLAQRAKAGTAGSDHGSDSGTLGTATNRRDRRGPGREDAGIQQAAGGITECRDGSAGRDFKARPAPLPAPSRSPGCSSLALDTSRNGAVTATSVPSPSQGRIPPLYPPIPALGRGEPFPVSCHRRDTWLSRPLSPAAGFQHPALTQHPAAPSEPA